MSILESGSAATAHCNASSQPAAGRDKVIFALKGLAIVGVVFHHVSNRRFSPEMQAQIAVLPSLFTWCVLLFFATSGWLHSLTDEKKSKSTGAFLRSRGQRLLLPFFGLVVVYASAWQVLQALEIKNVGVRLSTSFPVKLVQNLPFLDYNPVAEQLYFLPFLFVISSVFHLLLRGLGISGIWGGATLVLIAGIILSPDSINVGAHLGVILFGGFCYASGFLMHHHRRWKYRSVVVILVTSLCFLVLGIGGLSKVVPLLILECASFVPLANFRLLCKIGEASGTIYIYHVPFILVPLIILVTHLPVAFQFIGVLAAGVIAMAACMALYFALRNTRLKWMLL